MARGHRTRRRWSREEKRRIVAQTLIPGVSVSQVARRYDVNTNLVFTRMLHKSLVRELARPFNVGLFEYIGACVFALRDPHEFMRTEPVGRRGV